MSDPTKVLEPNRLGDTVLNRGVESLVANYGFGVPEAQGKPETIGPDEHKHKTRVAKAREFGKKKEEVGF